MLGGRSRAVFFLVLGLLLLGDQTNAEQDEGERENTGEMKMDMGDHEMSEEMEMEMGSDLPSCFETNKAYVGYPMDNPESGGRYLEKCPNPQHCQMMCQEDARCEWFNWSNSTCAMSGKQITKCWMKTGKGNAKEIPGVITGPKYCKPERSCIERDRMYIGDGLNRWVRRKNNFGRQKTEADCQDLCKRTKYCRWFNWNKNSKCWLKRSHGQRAKANVRIEPGVSTGPRECRPIPAGERCDEGWQYFDRRCYLINLKRDTETITFADASQMCLDSGALLVSLHSEKEYNFITDNLDRNYFQQEGIDFWVGAKRPSDDAGYTWQEDQTDVQVFNWAEGEPSPGNRCLQLVKDNSASWVYRTEECDSEDDDGSFICEKAANEVSIDRPEQADRRMDRRKEFEEDETTEASEVTTEASEATTSHNEPEDSTRHEAMEEGSGSQSDITSHNVDVTMPCSTPVISNGNMNCNDDNDDDDDNDKDCLLTCNDGYSPYPYSSYSCRDGAWTRAEHPIRLENIKCSPSKLVIGGCSLSTNTTMIQLSDSTETCRLPPLSGDDSCYHSYTLDFVDGELLACGGNPTPTRCSRFDYESKSWQEVTQLDDPRINAVSVVLGSTMYLIGGANNSEIEAITPKVSFDLAEGKLFTHNVAGDCSVGISSDTILTLTEDNFFSYNVTSGSGDDMTLEMDLKDYKVPCTLYTSDGRRKMLVTNAFATSVGGNDEYKGARSFIYDVESQAWSNTAETPSFFPDGQLVTMEGGNIILINPTEQDSLRTLRYTPSNSQWENFESMSALEQSTLGGPATTVPGDFFTCEKFGIA